MRRVDWKDPRIVELLEGRLSTQEVADRLSVMLGHTVNKGTVSRTHPRHTTGRASAKDERRKQLRGGVANRVANRQGNATFQKRLGSRNDFPAQQPLQIVAMLYQILPTHDKIRDFLVGPTKIQVFVKSSTPSCEIYPPHATANRQGKCYTTRLDRLTIRNQPSCLACPTCQKRRPDNSEARQTSQFAGPDWLLSDSRISRFHGNEALEMCKS
ncbi:hypothetical protein L596_016559 [Steinernema carpocapsae]|uniref:Uncharacterized protein n=1 Tax=Steinernema carpocapsae TaxID=34508 RepID=A0A4U5NIB0_STECR|nr:hypothetical protein L596_016559 [Steinernema carpocapsae]